MYECYGIIFSTHYSTMEHLTTDNYLKSINRLFQRTANTSCSLKHLNFKYNCTYSQTCLSDPLHITTFCVIRPNLFLPCVFPFI